MNAVNAVQLFILVCFSAVCQADDDFIVSCDNVTGSVEKEVTFTCSVSLQRTECCVKSYKFQYPEGYNDSAICKEEPPVNPCDQRNSFTCRYTPTTAMTEQFRFFVQTQCGSNKTKFTVNIIGPIKSEIGNEAPGEKAEIKNQIVSGPSPSTAIAAVMGCFILLLIIIVIMTVIRNKKPNLNTYCGFQKRMFLGLRHDEDNSDHPEDVINYSAV